LLLKREHDIGRGWKPFPNLGLGKPYRRTYRTRVEPISGGIEGTAMIDDVEVAKRQIGREIEKIEVLEAIG
jgi:hypothetical protein